MTDKPKYDNSGILFFQDDKDADNKPDWKGNITVKGEELELAGWIKPGKRGNFITLKVSEKRRQDVSSTVPATQGRGNASNANTAQRTRPQDPPTLREYAGEQPGMRGRRELPPDDHFDDDLPF